MVRKNKENHFFIFFISSHQERYLQGLCMRNHVYKLKKTFSLTYVIFKGYKLGKQSQVFIFYFKRRCCEWLSHLLWLSKPRVIWNFVKRFPMYLKTLANSFAILGIHASTNTVRGIVIYYYLFCNTAGQMPPPSSIYGCLCSVISSFYLFLVWNSIDTSEQKNKVMTNLKRKGRAHVSGCVLTHQGLYFDKHIISHWSQVFIRSIKFWWQLNQEMLY